MKRNKCNQRKFLKKCEKKSCWVRDWYLAGAFNRVKGHRNEHYAPIGLLLKSLNLLYNPSFFVKFKAVFVELITVLALWDDILKIRLLIRVHMSFF